MRLHITLMASALLVPTLTSAYRSPKHIFSTNDIQGDFDGNTFETDSTILCGCDACVTCPEESDEPFADRDGTMLYPIDSEFGFTVADFDGAEAKVRDSIYQEGFAGDITDTSGQLVGIRVSDAATSTYKVKPPLGTWCQGLGGSSVKCSTEHYVVMEHVLTVRPCPRIVQ